MLGQQVNLQALADTHWDVVVIGGGITGAGIFLESARRGLKVLLLEQQDFSWGTSSRSSKMVHGGLRYIAQGDIPLTHHSLQERERLLRELPDLVVRMSYFFPIRKGQFPGRLSMQMVMIAYDALASIKDHEWLEADAVQSLFPALNGQQLKGALRYTDALTDDSRLVIRVLQEGCLEGGTARNYSKVTGIEQQQDGQMQLQVSNTTHPNHAQQTCRITAQHVFNATGLWADQLSSTAPRIRPQRGSHLFIARDRLPIDSCLTLLHPDDKRYVFVYPWKGETCVGTTDLDHRFDIHEEAFCTEQEVDYLLKLVNHEFPGVNLERRDIHSTMAGVRPIIASGAGRDPSKERRTHLVWQSNGIVSVSGGKLTTFRQIALDALATAGIIDAATHKSLLKGKTGRCFNHSLQTPKTLDQPLAGIASGLELEQQVRWILQHEMVQHLDDLMLRRLRAGNLLPDAGTSLLAQLKPLCQELLHWNDQQWQQEVSRYQAICQRYYQPQPAEAQAFIAPQAIAGLSSS
jgi:glycerol-3-phosphate dehydrogenase